MSWKLPGGLSALLTAALVVVACGPAATPTPAAKPTEVPSAAAKPAAAAPPTPVDIIEADGPVVWFYALNNAIAPLDEYFPKDYVDKSYAPSSLATSYFRGKFYAPPMSESCSLMWFNTELTDKAGIK